MHIYIYTHTQGKDVQCNELMFFGGQEEILYWHVSSTSLLGCQVYSSSLKLCGNTKSVLSSAFNSKCKLLQPENNQSYFHIVSTQRGLW